MPCEVDLELLEFTDSFDEHLRMGSCAVQFGICRFEIGDGSVVDAPRYTSAGGENNETQHSSCYGADLHASPRCVALHTIAQRAMSSVAPTSRWLPGYPFLQLKSLSLLWGAELIPHGEWRGEGEGQDGLSGLFGLFG